MKTLSNFKQREEKNNFVLFFESNDLPRVQYLLETKQFNQLMQLSHEKADKSDICLLLVLTQGGHRFTVQLFEFLASEYESISPRMEFSTKEALQALRA